MGNVKIKIQDMTQPFRRMRIEMSLYIGMLKRKKAINKRQARSSKDNDCGFFLLSGPGLR